MFNPATMQQIFSQRHFLLQYSGSICPNEGESTIHCTLFLFARVFSHWVFFSKTTKDPAQCPKLTASKKKNLQEQTANFLHVRHFLSYTARPTSTYKDIIHLWYNNTILFAK
ncbi:hypothetical protein LXL04_005362 [Taraxacum kok-saghyz]